MFQWGLRTYVMGIINVTPDSFSGDGVAASGDGDDNLIERAVAQAQRFMAEGADILDIGGESTRPGSRPVTTAEEKARIVPAIKAIYDALPQSVISVDTYRAEVAEAALDAGANWVNDVWGLRMDPAMAELVAGRNCPIIVMHNRSKPKDAVQEARLGGRYIGIHYTNLMIDIKTELSQQIELALAAGVRPEQIIIDPGIGFGKTVEQNLEILDRMNDLKTLGFPLLSGPSRKSFISYTLDLPPDQRLEGTAAAVAISIDRGADIVRVHDVGPMVRIARMTDAIARHR